MSCSALYGADRQLRSYDITDAQAQFLLARAGFVTDQFEDHVDLGSGVVLISTSRVIFFNEEGIVRQVLDLADLFMVQVVDEDSNDMPVLPKAPTVSCSTSSSQRAGKSVEYDDDDNGGGGDKEGIHYGHQPSFLVPSCGAYLSLLLSSQQGVLIHYQVKLNTGESAQRRLMVPCEASHGRLLKYKIDLASLNSKSK